MNGLFGRHRCFLNQSKKISNNREQWHFEEEPLPLTSLSFGNLIITDEDLLTELKKAPKGNAVLEMEISLLCA